MGCGEVIVGIFIDFTVLVVLKLCRSENCYKPFVPCYISSDGILYKETYSFGSIYELRLAG